MISIGKIGVSEFPGGIDVSSLWADLPIGRVVQLSGASPAAMELMLTPLPDDAPAVVTYRPSGVPSRSAIVEEVLRELEAATRQLFPAWLPDAEGIGPGGAGIPAVRALAMRLASSTVHFGPFLADLAEGAVRGAAPTSGRFPAEVRSAGLARVLAASFARDTTALLVRVPDGLTGDDEDNLVDACEWLAASGGLGVWLVGSPLRVVDRVMTVRVALPAAMAREERGIAVADVERGSPVIECPYVAGRPRANSQAEKRLAAALSKRSWAVGGRWNDVYQPHELSERIELDLVWHAEKLVVELDGREHRGARHYRKDRERDIGLQLNGYVVLRFTNEQVLGDIGIVLSQIKKLIETRRAIATAPS